MKVTYKAHPVQGLTCFHGYRDRKNKKLSIDMIYAAIGSLETKTSFELETSDLVIKINGEEPDKSTNKRIMDYVRSYYPEGSFHVESQTNFKIDVGLASSASAYSCIAGCLVNLLNLTKDSKNVSEIARKGSFSASASVTGGLSLVRKEGYSEQIFSPDELRNITMIVALAMYDKKQFDFYQEAETSPFLEVARCESENTADQLIQAFRGSDIDKLAYLAEKHVQINYTVLQTGKNRLFLWKPESVKTMLAVRQLRTKGLPMFYSMNTGGNVFVYCFDEKATEQIKGFLKKENIDFLVSKIGDGMVEVK